MTLTNINQYGPGFQVKVLAALLSHKEFLINIHDIISEEYFESQAHKWIIKEILKYYDKYHTTPSLEVLKVEIKKLQNEVLQIAVKEQLREAYKESDDLAYVEEEFSAFCKNQMLKKALLQSVDLLQAGDYDSIKYMIESAMKYANISEDRVNFRISEYLTVGLSVSKKGSIYINDDELNEETTLESLFSSPLVPIVNKNFYPILLEVSQNLDKFVELDVVKRINNLINPYLECFAFNYKNTTFLYRCDERYGNSFFKYESALELVNEVRNELNYDLTYFYENKLDKELIVKRKLEDKEREISLKLEDVNFNIEKVKGSIQMIGESEVLTTALGNLIKRKENLDGELLGVKELQYKERTKEA